MMIYLTEAPKPTSEQLAQIEQLRAKAKIQDDRAEKSFQRCDTDGFLSQWANNIGADRDRKQAKLLENGGYARFPVLCDSEGNVICHTIRTFYNPHPRGWGEIKADRWQLPDDLADKLGRKWIPVGYNSRIQKQLGLHEEDRWFPAVAEIMGGGTGMAGAANCYVSIRRRDMPV